MINSRIYVPITLGFFLGSTHPVFADAPWVSGGLQCAVQTLSVSDKLDYMNEAAGEIVLNPDDCVVGHWSLDSDLYAENLLRMTENLEVSFDDISAAAEIIIDPEGISHGCVDISFHGTMVSRGLEASVVLTMRGPTISLISYKAETAEELEGIWDGSPHFVSSLSDGVLYQSVITVDGTSYVKDIEPTFSLFAVDADISCAGNSMTIITFPPGVDFVESRLVRVD